MPHDGAAAVIVIGLTGSIGMGKSTTSQMFADEGVPVWDADAVVHRLYLPGAPGSRAVAGILPDAVGAQGVDRARLRKALLADRSLLDRMERAVHPLVAADRTRFLDQARAEGHAVALCDIPLLFETGAEGWVDHVVVVTAPPEIQRDRALRRPGLTEAAFEALLAKQLPDAEKRRRADTVIDTGQGLDHARAQVRACLQKLRSAPDA